MADEQNVFSVPMEELQRWSSDEPLSANKLNAPLDAIDHIVKGVPPPTQVPRQQGGGGGTGLATPVSIIEAPTEEANKLKVQPLKWVDDNLVNDGAVKTVRPWPDRTNADYAPFVGKPDILAMMNLGGKLCVMHHIRFSMRQPPEDAQWGGCP